MVFLPQQYRRIRKILHGKAEVPKLPSKFKKLKKKVNRIQKLVDPHIGRYNILQVSTGVNTTYTTGVRILCNVAQGDDINQRAKDHVKLLYSDINWAFTNTDTGAHKFCRMIVLWTTSYVNGTNSKPFSTYLTSNGALSPDNIHDTLDILRGSCCTKMSKYLGLKGDFHIMYDSGPIELAPISGPNTFTGTNDATHQILAFGSGTPSRRYIRKRINWHGLKQFYVGTAAGSFDYGTPLMITIQDTGNIAEQGVVTTFFEN